MNNNPENEKPESNGCKAADVNGWLELEEMFLVEASSLEAVLSTLVTAIRAKMRTAPSKESRLCMGMSKHMLAFMSLMHLEMTGQDLSLLKAVEGTVRRDTKEPMNVYFIKAQNHNVN